ncbi:MAG: BspA family leucine-rich repeat surface protein, partial [Acidimicrobiaceae bacterium]|nr:BspA family leucine-rich repeat surface protein [Acidimicrobiaceae bacterium]
MLMISPVLLIVGASPAGAATTPMLLTVNTAAPGCTGTTVILPISGSVNATVNWGDGTPNTNVTSAFPTHTYTVSGTYTVSVDGSVSAFGAGSEICQLTGVTDWGSTGVAGEVGLTGLTSLEFAFYDDTNLTVVPSNFPTQVTSTYQMFGGATTFNQNIGAWNTASVGNMSYMFAGATAFNQNISSWNTAAVTDMSDMFA